ncbi:hypothetical protein [Secundilactobacillus collinoides]|uniref:hypothetical protein n=1 Tax=Secundilactobacillus collinoides TaxID=33960 RepID=UPI000A7815C8|nr:hypothetical protein [Secundilactobacillus collinoides]
MAKRHILIVSCQSAKQLIASDEDHFAQRSASHYDRWLDSGRPCRGGQHHAQGANQAATITNDYTGLEQTYYRKDD